MTICADGRTQLAGVMPIVGVMYKSARNSKFAVAKSLASPTDKFLGRFVSNCACRHLCNVYLGALRVFLILFHQPRCGACPFGPNENLKISAPGP